MYVCIYIYILSMIIYIYIDTYIHGLFNLRGVIYTGNCSSCGWKTLFIAPTGSACREYGNNQSSEWLPQHWIHPAGFPKAATTITTANATRYTQNGQICHKENSGYTNGDDWGMVNMTLFYLVGGLEHFLFLHLLGMSLSQLTNS